LREDIPSAPEWILPLLYSINQFFDTVYYALNRNLNFTENIDAQWKVFRITAGAAATDNTYSFLITMRNKPRGLSLEQVQEIENTYVPITSPVFISWRVNANQISIDAISGLTSGKTYDLTVLLK
jgi:hypothetical protein